MPLQTTNIIHLRREDQLQLQGVTPMQADFRALAVLISMSAKRLLIDSFAQHAAAALQLPSVVCWVGNLPSQFGYSMHTNITANEPTVKPELRHGVFGKYNITGNALEFPYNSEEEVFNADDIIAAVINTPAPAGFSPPLPSHLPPENNVVPDDEHAKGKSKQGKGNDPKKKE